MDGIPYSFILHANSDSKQFFLDILNKLFLSGTPPEDWKTQIIVPILKPGKLSNDPSGYRPIALSSTLAKILEHLIKNRLEWLVESKGLLARSQFGFRKGLGTMDSLAIFSTDIRIAFSKCESVVGVFLDIASAYDNVLLPRLRQKLHDLNLPERLVNFTVNLLLSRSIIVSSNNTSLPPRLVWKGLPQGSVLSPLLYSLYTYDLELSVNCFCSVLQYADDICLYASASNILDTVPLLSSALNYLSIWLENHGLSLSISKSTVVPFTRKRSIPDLSVCCNGVPIPVSDRVKFLGVIFDSKLSGVHHINYAAKKCEKNINIIRSLSGVWWGSHPYCQKLVYNALVRSNLDYGSFLLEPCNKLALNSLDKIQSKSLRIVIGAMRSSPINALQIECVDPPLNLRRQYLSDRFIFKLMQSSTHPLISKLHSLSQLIISSNYWSRKDSPCLIKSYLKITRLPCPIYQSRLNPIFETSYEAIMFRPSILLDLGIDKDSVSANSLLNKAIDKLWPNWITIYTDASQLTLQGSVGSAVWIPRFKVILNYKLPSYSSVFTGEAVGILEALKYIDSHDLHNCVIFTDSKSSLQAILANQFRSKFKFTVILEIKRLLHCLSCKNVKVSLAWIPGHVGIPGNEIADQCAKDASERGCLSTFKCYAQDLLSLAKVRLGDDWFVEWSRSSQLKGIHYAELQDRIPVRPWFFRYREATKKVTSTICRLRLGHSCTPVFLHKIRVKDSSLCECGLDEGTLDHILFECCRLSSSLYDVLPPYIPRPVNSKSLLRLVFTSFIAILCEFISLNNIRL